MANGEEAAEAGMDVVPSTAKWRLGYDEINRTRDYVARFSSAAKAYALELFSSISLSWDAITGRPTVFPPSPHSHDISQVVTGGNNLSQRMWFHTPDTTLRSQGDSAQLTVTSDGRVVSPQVRSRVVTGWYNVGVAADGTIGQTVSSRQYKRDIHDWDPGGRILDIALREFRYLEDLDPTDAVNHGAIAEELHELGLTWAVIYDEHGSPHAIRYELLGVALIPIVRDLAARVARLEGTDGG